jgi:hypothetical protein
VKDLFNRLGHVEAAIEANTKALEAHNAVDTKSHDDHEGRLRKLEHLTAKVVGGAIVGSALGGWILSKIGLLLQ